MIQSRAKGTRLERMVKHRLEEKGYVVIRSAGSHGPFDLIALKLSPPDAETRLDEFGDGYEVLCVQVKANRTPTRAQAEVMSRFLVPSEVWVHRDRADVWDVYDPTPLGLRLSRQESYVQTGEVKGEFVG